MSIKIQWTSNFYNSVEDCVVSQTQHGIQVSSAVKGNHQGNIYSMEYLLQLDVRWNLLSGHIFGYADSTIINYNFKKNEDKSWMVNDTIIKEFTGVSLIDISLTPFTNSLPINSLRWQTHKTQEIAVIYFDILNREVKAATQNYTKLSADEYKYENVPNDFEAVIQVDASGLVVNYPGLFIRTF